MRTTPAVARALVLLATNLVAIFALFACAPSAPPPPKVAPTTSAASSSPPTPAPPSPAAAATPAGQPVQLANGGNGYLALPTSGPAKHPAILVIQEWWGLNDWIKANTDRFASQGYVALAVDLYRGRTASSPDEAHELMRALNEDRGIADMKAAFDLLAARPDVDPKRIGIIGWCMGGGYALDLATVEPRLRAAVVNYGHLETDPAKIDGIKASLLGNFGGKDRGILPADVKAFESALKAKGKEIDFKVYENDGHAFMNPNNKTGYDDETTKDAWRRIDAFFARTLKAP